VSVAEITEKKIIVLEDFNESVLNNDSEIQNYKHTICLNCPNSWKKMDRERNSARK